MKIKKGGVAISRGISLLFIQVMRSVNADIRRTLKMELTSSQIHLLRLLEMHGPLKMSELAEKLQITLGGVTSLANRMCKARLIERRRSEEDRRVVRLAVTAEGAAFLEKLTVARDQALDHYFDRLSKDELAELERLYRKMLNEPNHD